MSNAVFCLTKSQGQAELIVSRLKAAGFSSDDISVLFPDKQGTRDFAHEKNTKAPEGAATGAGTGGAIGGVLGWLAGIGSLAIPGVGPFIAAGPIMAALSGAAIGATVGGISGALVGMGIPEYEAKRFEGKIKEGNILISVHTEDRDEVKRAKEIFEREGASDISTAGEEGIKKDERTVNPPASADPGRFVDYSVVDQAGDKIGTVDAIWEDASGQPAYLAVRTGWLGMGKAHVIPVHSGEVNDRSRTIRIPFTASQVKEAPAFDCSADIDSEAEERVESYYARHGYTRAAVEKRSAPAPDGTVEATEEARVQLKEEEVKIGKRVVEYGKVRLRKIVRTETVNKPVELKREEIVIERVPVSGAAAAAGDATFAGEDIYVPLRREEAVVQKEAHVREEVRVGKRQERETKTVSETIRKEDVEIDENAVPESRLEKGSGRPLAAPYQPKERGRNG